MSPETLKEIGASIEEHITDLQNTVFNAAGREFNLNSPKQLGEVLFEELKLWKNQRRLDWAVRY